MLYHITKTSSLYMILQLLVFALDYTGSDEPSTKGCQRFQTLRVVDHGSKPVLILPWTVREAVLTGWNKVTRNEKYNVDIYRYDDLNIIFIFFFNDALVGVGPTYNPRKIGGLGFNTRYYTYEQRDLNGGFQAALNNAWKRIPNIAQRSKHFFNKLAIFEDVQIRYAMILFVHPDVLKQGLSDPCLENTIYFEDDSDWYTVPYLAGQIQPDVHKLHRQGCWDKRGIYYFYAFPKKAFWRLLHGFFATYNEEGQLTGFGTLIYGDSNIHDYPYPLPIYKRVYDEDIGYVISHPSSGFMNRANNKGLTIFHMAITNTTKEFECSEETLKLDQ